MSAPGSVIDPFDLLPGEDRCIHDQLIFRGRSTCAFCQQLPDIPNLDAVHPAPPESPSVHEPRWIHAQWYVDCASCGVEQRPDTRVQWVPDLAGVLCEACAEKPL